MLWAVCCTTFFGFFRLGELLRSSPSEFNPRLHLSWGDMAVDSPPAPTMVRFHLRQSKTDQFGPGVDIILGRTGCDLCPVAAVLGYVAARGDRKGSFFLKSTNRPEAGVHHGNPQGADRAGPPRSPVCWPQFPYRSCNVCSPSGRGRLHHPDSWSVAKCGIPPVH